MEHPKGFFSAVLKNKYNGWLREKYKKDVVEYSDETVPDCSNVIRRRRVLVFKENNEYFIRSFVSVRLWILYTFDGKAEALPEYDFSYKCDIVAAYK